MSQTNGVTGAVMNHFNGNNNTDDTSFEVLENFCTLIPKLEQNLNLIFDQFKQLLNYAKEFEKLSSAFRVMHSKEQICQRELEQLKNDLAEMEQHLQNNADNRVYLDVGGQRFTTTVRTLTEQFNSMFFKTLIAKRWNKDSNSPDNAIFIDRDGRLFDFILIYLRTGELIIDDKSTIKELLIEAKYYKLQNLEDDLNAILRKDELFGSLLTVDGNSQSPPSSPAPTVNKTRSSPYSPTVVTNSVFRTSPLKSKLHPAQTASSWRSHVPFESRLNRFPGSVLLTSEYEDKLIEFIGADIPPQQAPWRLIYRATEYGFDAADFHRCCDSFAPTVSIIQTDTGNIFGGFTAVAWSSASLRADQADTKAFLFTLKNSLNIPPTKFPVAKDFQQCAISHNPTCGPNFGSPKNEGSDLCLRNKFNEKTNCIFFPKSYVDSTNQGGLVFAKKYFACKEVEVFTTMIENQRNVNF